MKKKSTRQNSGTEQKPYKKYLPYLLFVVVGFALYAQTLQFGFSSLDDEPIIVQKSSYLSNISNSVDVFRRDAFLEPKGEFYRPLQSLSFIINAQISGTEAWSYHLINVLLFIIVIALVYYFLRQNGMSESVALLASMLLLLHPLAAHLVCWVPARGDLLLIICILLSAILFNKFLTSRRKVFAGVHAVLFLLALFAKETAVMFIPIGLFYIYRSKNPDRMKTALTFSILWSIDLIAYFVLRHSVLIDLPSQNFGFGVFLKNLPSVPEMFGKIFIPYPLSPMPHIRIVPVIMGLVLFTILLYIIFVKFKADASITGLSLLWFFCFILPPLAFRSSFADFGYEYLEHRAILPAIGLLLLLIPVQKSLEVLLKKYKFYALIPAAGLFIFTYVHAGIYSDPKSFFNAAIKADSKNAVANYQLGCMMITQDNYEGALPYFTNAVAIAPGESEYWNTLAAMYYNTNNYDKALYCFLESLKLNPNNWQTLRNLGTLYTSKNNFEIAIAYYTKALALTPDKGLILNDRANAKFLSNDFTGAINDCEAALAVQQDAPDVLLTKAKSLIKLGKNEDAFRVLVRAEQLDSQNLEILFYKGVASVNLHRESEGIKDIQAASQNGFQPAVEYLRANPRLAEK